MEEIKDLTKEEKEIIKEHRTKKSTKYVIDVDDYTKIEVSIKGNDFSIKQTEICHNVVEHEIKIKKVKDAIAVRELLDRFIEKKSK